MYLKEKQRECVDGLLKIIRPVDTAKSSPEANCTDKVISKQKKCQGKVNQCLILLPKWCISSYERSVRLINVKFSNQNVSQVTNEVSW